MRELVIEQVKSLGKGSRVGQQRRDIPKAHTGLWKVLDNGNVIKQIHGGHPMSGSILIVTALPQELDDSLPPNDLPLCSQGLARSMQR